MYNTDCRLVKSCFIFYCSFLATGDSYNTLAARFCLGVSTVQKMVTRTCDVIWSELQPNLMPPPTKEYWERIESGFSTRWNFPNCVGALDGKHVVMTAPAKSGSLFHNYKGTFSIVLMALVDSSYRFTFVDIGDYGSNADGAIFARSAFGQALLDGELDLPGPKELPNYPQGGVLPHCIVADEAFPLRPDIIRPYPRANRQMKLTREEQIFNYRLSRARRIVENGFGILVQRFRVFNRKLQLMPQNADKVVKACCMLHNYLTEEQDYHTMCNRLNPDQDPFLHEDGAILDLDNLNGYRSAAAARALRNIFRDYFARPEGAVTWQDRAIY